MNTYSKLKEMFAEMVVKKNADLIPHYYHTEFLMTTNGQSMDYAEMLKFHKDIYQTPIQYAVAYEDETAVIAENKVAVRMTITTTLPGESPKELELILIATYKDEKIHRIWELTYPDWSQDDTFQETLDKL